MATKGDAMRCVHQVGQVREVEVRAARGEGANEARQVADQERTQLQHEHQERLQQFRAQEQLVRPHLPTNNLTSQ